VSQLAPPRRFLHKLFDHLGIIAVQPSPPSQCFARSCAALRVANRTLRGRVNDPLCFSPPSITIAANQEESHVRHKNIRAALAIAAFITAAAAPNKQAPTVTSVSGLGNDAYGHSTSRQGR
jgi:hypothetical protein